jgi:hypothetical protein
MSVTGNAAVSDPISMIPPGVYSSAMAWARRNKINEPMQRIISSAIALGLLIVGFCFLYLGLFEEVGPQALERSLGISAGFTAIASL